MVDKLQALPAEQKRVVIGGLMLLAIGCVVVFYDEEQTDLLVNGALNGPLVDATAGDATPLAATNTGPTKTVTGWTPQVHTGSPHHNSIPSRCL